MKKIFIIDNDENFIRELKDSLNNLSNYKLMGVSNDGNNIIEKLRNIKEIDFLLINTLIPLVDGLNLLRNIKNESEIMIKHIIIVQYFVNEYVINSYKDFNVDDYIIKPCHPITIVNHLKQFDGPLASIEITENMLKDNSIEKKISLILHEVGIPAHIKGYVYLREAIKKCYYSNEGYMGNITKRLYPEIAKEFFTTGSRVERAIRHAIELSFNRGDVETINKIFGYSISKFKDKPTNSEFISIFADYLKIDNKESVNN